MLNDNDPLFNEAQFLSAMSRLLVDQFGGDGVVSILDITAGTFNSVVKLSYGGRMVGARLSLRRRGFRYEPDIVKEVFAIALLNQAGATIGDAAARSIIDRLLAAPSGKGPEHASVRRIVYYDWSLAVLPYSFFLFEWVEGDSLWEQPFTEHYHQAGQLLAGLHRVQFDHFYENIFTVHHTPRSWRDHIRVCLHRELARAEFNLPAKLIQRLTDLDMSTLAQGRPCLVHNDFAGANLLIDGDRRLHAIDWDNWVVDCPELDLVKMKYWTAIGREGRLAHRSGLYDAFVEGYRDAAGHPIDAGRLRAYEHLWLLRCYNFECSRHEESLTPLTPNSWQPVYPGPDYYLDLLRDF